MNPRSSHRIGIALLTFLLLLAAALAIVTASRREQNPHRNVIPYGRIELVPLTEQQVREQCLPITGGEVMAPGTLRFELAQPGPGRLTGAVRYTGEAKPARAWGCAPQPLAPKEAISDVAIWATGFRGYEPFTGTIALDLQACGFEPPVRAVANSSKLEIANARPSAVTLLATNPAGEEAAKVEVPASARAKLELPKPSLYRLTAEESPAGWLLTLEHAIAGVSDAAGQLVVNGAPPGTYTLCYWHEQLGTGGGIVTVQQ